MRSRAEFECRVLFDHLIGSPEEGGWDRPAEPPGRGEVDAAPPGSVPQAAGLPEHALDSLWADLALCCGEGSGDRRAGGDEGHEVRQP
jgi:hypothetical protein